MKAANHDSPPGAPAVVGTQRRLPLAGRRMLDLSRAWAGPYGTHYPADFGAEVIKAEVIA